MIGTHTMNTSLFQAERILLGVGGSRPGIQAYDAVSDSLEGLLSLDEGHSVYAIDISPDGRIIAAGTKAGVIYWITKPREDEGFLIEQLTYGRPLVSISFVGTSTIAVVDTAGHCCIWRPGEDTHPDALSAGGRLIYRLFRLNTSHLAGLSRNGDLLVWDCLKNDLVQEIEAPAPPKKFLALVKPVYWPAAGVWVWPGANGLIVFYDQHSNKVRSISTALGAAYAIVTYKEQLLMIGTDGYARRWYPASGEQADVFKAPHRIVSATSWQKGNDVMLLLINEEGEAGVYVLNYMSLEFVKPLPGQGYRVAIGPDSEKLNLAVQQQEMIRVQELTAHVSKNIARQQYSELEKCYSDLDELGYRHVALALRGQQARKENDCVSELRVYRELAEIIPHDHPNSESALARYAELLEFAWRLSRACKLYRELADRYSDNRLYAEAVQRLSSLIGITKRNKYVIVSDLPISSLIEFAMVLEESLRGRYLLEARRPVSCRAVLDAGEFIKKYEQCCHGNPTLPTAEQMNLHWLSEDKAEQITTVVFKNEALDQFSHIELGMKFFSTRLQTVLVPVLMLNAKKNTDRISVEQNNENLVKELQQIEGDHFKGWLEMVERSINHVMRQLISQKQAEKIRQSGGIRC